MTYHTLCTLYGALLAMVVAAPVAAQSHGAGISGQTFDNDISADYIREHLGPPDSVRLVAAVLWRGSTDWTMNRGPSAAIAHARLDSLRPDADRRGMLAGGTVTATANAWVEYDARSHSVIILNRAYPVARGDSTTVIMVDRVDHVGGDPIVSTATLVCSRSPEADLHAGFTPAARRAMSEMAQHWHACLETNPGVATFLNRGPSR